MALDYPPRKASELTYFLYERRIPDEAFEIFRSRRVEREHFVADVWITGAGHVLRFDAFDKAFTEVVAAASGSLPSENVIESAGLILRDFTFARNEPRFRYQVSSRKLVIGDEADYEEKHSEIEEMKSGGLFFAFPATDGARLAAFTSVAVSDAPFAIETVHAYPAETTLIYTRTKIDLETAG